MKTEYSFYSAQFFTATIYEWQPVLADNQFKNIIIDSLQFLVTKKRIELNAFVPIVIGMHNHIHLIWQAMNDFTPSAIQASFMKYTAQQIKRSLIKNNPDMLANFKVNKYDRDYQIWKREPLSVELITQSMLYKSSNTYTTARFRVPTKPA